MSGLAGGGKVLRYV